MSQHNWNPSWEKVPGNMYALWVRLQRLHFTVPVYIPREANWYHHQSVSKLEAWFKLMMFVLSCKTWDVVKPGAWLARAPPGAQQSQDSSPILYTVLQVLHSQKGVTHSHSQLGQCPGRLEARSKACSALSLKPKQDYLISPNKTPTLGGSPSLTLPLIPWLHLVQLLLFVKCFWTPCLSFP